MLALCPVLPLIVSHISYFHNASPLCIPSPSNIKYRCVLVLFGFAMFPIPLLIA